MSDRLFASEAFCQMAGQMSMEAVEPTFSALDVDRLAGAAYRLGADHVAYVVDSGQVENRRMGAWMANQLEAFDAYGEIAHHERRWFLLRCHCCRQDFYGATASDPYCDRCLAVGNGR